MVYDVRASSAWYKEIKDYDFDTQKSTGGAVGHFTQLVWKNSKKVGFGFKVGPRKMWGMELISLYVVARYNPAVNYRGQFKENVPRLI